MAMSEARVRSRNVDVPLDCSVCIKKSLGMFHAFVDVYSYCTSCCAPVYPILNNITYYLYKQHYV